jgi:hypothetical protein
MKRQVKTVVSDKIEVNKDKIYRISDPIQLVEIFFPAKNACNRRAAFLAIFFEIKNADNQRVESTDYIAGKYDLSQSSIIKARVKMSRIGLIRRREACWIFSSVFSKSLQNLAGKIEVYKKPANTIDERNRERMFVELAKGIR